MKSERFYLACTRDNVGTNTAFHAKGGNGYTTNIAMAHEYTRDEAQRAWEMGREIDLPLCADLVDAQTVWHVDHQHIPCENTIKDDCIKYVAYQTKRWDGNDVYWLTDTLPSTDFSKARIYDEPVNERSLIWLPFHIADKEKRKTFSSYLINRRKMIQAAGLLTPVHIKRYQRKNKSSGKTRGNCPICGKITWDFNPHENAPCKEHEWEYRINNTLCSASGAF